MDTALGLVWNEHRGAAGRRAAPVAQDPDPAPVMARTAVPTKPSLEMLTAGARAGSVSVETAWKIYQAMIGTP
jgi:hypothetical protein